MIKRFCDACDKEITNSHLNEFSYLCHLESMLDGTDSHSDSEGNRTSQRTVSKELCNKCYNEIVIVAVKKLRELERRIRK